jgi:hypothetical protein
MAASISNSARKSGLVTGQTVSPAPCSVNTTFVHSLSDLTGELANGDPTLRSLGGSYLVSNTGWMSMIGIRLRRWRAPTTCTSLTMV